MTFDRVKEIIAEHTGVDEAEITPEAAFADFYIDSLDTVEILMEMEDEFGVEINVEEIGKTIGDLVNLIDANK